AAGDHALLSASRAHRPLAVRWAGDRCPRGLERSQSGHVDPVQGPRSGSLELRHSERPARPGCHAVSTIAHLFLHALGGLLIMPGEVICRDAFVTTASEGRWETELLGLSVDPSGFLGIRAWPYDVIRLANITLHGVSAAPAGVLDAPDKAATLGYLQTIKALE